MIADMAPQFYSVHHSEYKMSDQASILAQVTIYRRLWIGRDGHSIYRNLYENTGSDQLMMWEIALLIFLPVSIFKYADIAHSHTVLQIQHYFYEKRCSPKGSHLIHPASAVFQTNNVCIIP